MPNRVIKESLTTSEKISSLSDFEFRLWISLIVLVDDAGRGDARPAIIKGRAFPLRERLTTKDINDALNSLAAKGCVSLYKVGGRPYFWFPTWANHQRIRDCKPKYPGPDEADFPTSPQVAADCGNLRPESNPIQSESNPYPNPTTNPTRADAREASSVVAEYLNRVNPSASQRSLDELMAFERSMGTEICLRAIDIALDNRKTSWAYIKAILQRWSSEGVKCIADIEALDLQHEQEKRSGGKYKPGVGATVPQPGKIKTNKERERQDMEQMKRYLRQLKSEDGALDET